MITYARYTELVSKHINRTITTAQQADRASQFARAKPADVAEILKTLATLGRAHIKGDTFTR